MQTYLTTKSFHHWTWDRRGLTGLFHLGAIVIFGKPITIKKANSERKKKILKRIEITSNNTKIK